MSKRQLLSAGDLHSLRTLRALRFAGLSAPSIFAASFSRLNGASEGVFRSLNTSFSVGDAESSVRENRELVLRSTEMKSPTLVIPKLCHGADIIVLKNDERPRDRDRSADAVISNIPNLAIMISTADCSPVFYFDPQTDAIGLAHSGWKGLVAHLPMLVVKQMNNEFGTKPSSLWIGIGPSIGPCCYRLREPAQLSMPEWAPYLTTGDDGLTSVDLWGFLEQQLVAAGIPKQQIDPNRVCTSCNSHLFFSFWKEKPRTGRFASILGHH